MRSTSSTTTPIALRHSREKFSRRTTNEVRPNTALRASEQRALDPALAVRHRASSESRAVVAADGARLLRAADSRLGVLLRQTPGHAHGARQRADGGAPH